MVEGGSALHPPQSGGKGCKKITSNDKKSRAGNRGIFSKHTKKRNVLKIETGKCKGLITTCSTTDTSKSIREFFNTVQMMEALEGPTFDKKVSENEANCSKIEESLEISELLEAERDEMMKKSKRFLPIKDVCRGVSFILFNDPQDKPSQFVQQMCDFVASKNSPVQFRYLCRVFPMDVVCKPHPEDFQRAAIQLIASNLAESSAAQQNDPLAGNSNEEEEKHLHKAETNGDIAKNKISSLQEDVCYSSFEGLKTWSCSYTSRCMNTISRALVLDVLQKAIGPDFTVDLTSPEITIIVDICPLLCGMSIVKGFDERKKFNVSKLAASPSYQVVTENPLLLDC